MSEELKPCHSCGEMPESHHSQIWTGMRYQITMYKYRCIGRDHSVECKGRTDEEAIAAWNRRAIPSNSTELDRDAVIEALEIGLDCAKDIADNTHAALKGYLPKDHEAVDADVAQIESVLRALKGKYVEQTDR